jgi:hypothetical protein
VSGLGGGSSESSVGWETASEGAEKGSKRREAVAESVLSGQPVVSRVHRRSPGFVVPVERRDARPRGAGCQGRREALPAGLPCGPRRPRDAFALTRTTNQERERRDRLSWPGQGAVAGRDRGCAVTPWIAARYPQWRREEKRGSRGRRARSPPVLGGQRVKAHLTAVGRDDEVVEETHPDVLGCTLQAPREEEVLLAR